MTDELKTDSVRLAARLPAGERNGLDALAAALAANPSGRYLVIAMVDVSEIKKRIDTDETTATLRIRRAEALLGPDSCAGEQLLRRAMERRTGRDALPSDVEAEREELDDGGDRQ